MACKTAQAALLATRYPVLRSVQVTCHEGLIGLRGYVPSYLAKQLVPRLVFAVSQKRILSYSSAGLDSEFQEDEACQGRRRRFV